MVPVIQIKSLLYFPPEKKKRLTRDTAIYTVYLLIKRDHSLVSCWQATITSTVTIFNTPTHEHTHIYSLIFVCVIASQKLAEGSCWTTMMSNDRPVMMCENDRKSFEHSRHWVVLAPTFELSFVFVLGFFWDILVGFVIEKNYPPASLFEYGSAYTITVMFV